MVAEPKDEFRGTVRCDVQKGSARDFCTFRPEHEGPHSWEARSKDEIREETRRQARKLCAAQVLLRVHWDDCRFCSEIESALSRARSQGERQGLQKAADLAAWNAEQPVVLNAQGLARRLRKLAEEVE